MAQIGDVARRLDQGQPTVDTFAELVWACGILGYQHPDLTAHVGQVQDWYASEDGLDLRTLDSDCAALTAAAASADQAQRLQDDQLTALDQAWHGHGAQAAREFLHRHAGAARQAVTGMRRAADILAALHEQLWRAVDSKVAVTERIEARCAAQRQDWLAAARTVRMGLGDRDAASELIDAQVKPFVANDIGADWVPAMRSATAAVADAYAAAIAALADDPAPVFEIPGDLGPSWTPSVGAVVLADPRVGAGRVPAGSAQPAGSGPVSWATPAGSMSAPPPAPQIASTAPTLDPPTIDPATPAMSPATSPAAADPAAAWGSPPGGGLSGAGVSGMGSGVSGLGQQLADLFGGLIGSTADGSLGSSADTALPGQLDPPETSDLLDDGDDPDNLDESGDEDRDHDDDAETAEDAATEEDTDTDEAADEQTVEADSVEGPAPGEAVVEPQPEPQPEPQSATAAAPGVPVPPAAPMEAPAGETPCEIAADELPQVGG